MRGSRSRPGQPRGSRRCSSTRASAYARGAAIQFGAQHPEQPHDALVVVAGDDGADSRQLLEARSAPDAEVERVDVDGRTPSASAAAAARVRRATVLPEPPVPKIARWPSTSGWNADDLLRLPLGKVAHAERQALVGAPAQLAQVDRRRELVEPRPARRGDARAARRLGDGRRPSASGRSGRGRAPRASSSSPGADQSAPTPNGMSATSTRGASARAAGPAAGVAGLEALEPAGSGLGDRAPGDRRVEVRGILHADDIERVGLVGHAQRDAQVGVGAQVVADDARRAAASP